MDFKNTVLIMTSNLGLGPITRQGAVLGFGADGARSADAQEAALNEQLMRLLIGSLSGPSS